MIRPSNWRWLILLGLGALAVIVVAFTVAQTYLNSSARYDRRLHTIDAYQRLDNPNQIVLDVYTGSWDAAEEPHVDEDSRQIRVTIWVDIYAPPPGGFQNAARYLHKITVTLRDPVGDRDVIDGATGTPVPRL